MMGAKRKSETKIIFLLVILQNIKLDQKQLKCIDIITIVAK